LDLLVVPVLETPVYLGTDPAFGLTAGFDAVPVLVLPASATFNAYWFEELAYPFSGMSFCYSVRSG
jgi:hypothetical protein